MQLKQPAPRCDAVGVALMNDLLLGAIATSLASATLGTVTLPAGPTPLLLPLKAPRLEFLVGGWDLPGNSTRIIRIVPKGDVGSVPTQWAEYPGTSWHLDRSICR